MSAHFFWWIYHLPIRVTAPALRVAVWRFACGNPERPAAGIAWTVFPTRGDWPCHHIHETIFLKVLLSSHWIEKRTESWKNRPVDGLFEQYDYWGVTGSSLYRCWRSFLTCSGKSYRMGWVSSKKRWSQKESCGLDNRALALCIKANAVVLRRWWNVKNLFRNIFLPDQFVEEAKPKKLHFQGTSG